MSEHRSRTLPGFLISIPSTINRSPRSNSARRVSLRPGPQRRPSRDLPAIRLQISQLVEAIEKADYSSLNLTETAIPEKYHLIEGPLPVPPTMDSSFEPVSNTFSCQTFPRISVGDRSQPLFIAQTLRDVIGEVDEKFPGHFRRSEIEDLDAAREEFAAWDCIFSECIRQVAVHCKALALILKTIQDKFMVTSRMLIAQVCDTREAKANVHEKPFLTLDHIQGGEMDVPHKTDFVKIHLALDTARIVDRDKFALHEALNSIQDLLKTRVDTDEDTARMGRELEALKENHRRLSIEKFEQEQQRIAAETAVSDLLEGRIQMRHQIADIEQKMLTLMQPGAARGMTEGLGRVPPEVLAVWEDLSHFCNAILSGDLLHIDFDQYFPPEPPPGFEPPVYAMKGPVYSEETVHFTTFFAQIKKMFTGKELFLALESQIQAFLAAVSRRYGTCFTAFRKFQGEVAQEAVQRLDAYLASAVDTSALLRTFVAQRTYLKIPTKKGPARDVLSTIAEVYRYSSDHPPDRSVTQMILNTLGGPESLDVLPFLAQIAKFSRSDPDADLFRQFVTRELPFHSFLFYADIIAKNAEIGPSEHRQRVALLAARFIHCGWENIARMKRQPWELAYCNDPKKFPLFCLAIYQFCIWQLEATVAGLEKRECEEAARTMLRLSGPQLFEAIEFMKKMSPDGKPGLKELAVLLFRKGAEFDKMLLTFDPAKSPVLITYASFGSKASEPAKPMSPRRSVRVTRAGPSAATSVEAS
jgi:hypothetical protein